MDDEQSEQYQRYVGPIPKKLRKKPSHYTMVPKKKPLEYPEPNTNPEQYNKPIGPVRQTKTDKVRDVVNTIRGTVNRVSNNPGIKRAVGYVKQRASDIADENERYARRPSRREPPIRSSPMSMDPFGIGMMGIDLGGRREEEPVRRKRRKRRKQAPTRRDDYYPTGLY